MKKSIVLIVLGVFVAVGCGLTTQINRVWPSMEIILLVYSGILAGVALSGLGIAQFVRARRAWKKDYN